MPIKWVIVAVALVISIGLVGFVTASDGGPSTNLVASLRYLPALAAVGIALLFGMWRWVPPVQRAIFPYLGGQWSGSLTFKGSYGTGERPITLEVKHTLFTLQLLLDSKESTSRTLVVQADRDRHFDRFRLYYVFLTERKEGLQNAGQSYRGVAIMRIELGKPMQLVGNYFTDENTQGELKLSFDRPNSWWQILR